MFDYEMPEILTNIKELQITYRAIIDEVQRFFSSAVDMEKELFAETASDDGLTRFENLLGLRHLETDTREERLRKIQYHDREIGCYSFGEIKRYLKEVAGENTTIECEEIAGRQRLKVTFDGISEKLKEEMRALLKEMLPVPMLLRLDNNKSEEAEE